MHQATRCNCRTCAIARSHRINPQQINNRPASIMRLAHNLNSLLATYHYLSKPKTLYLVAGCGKQTNQKAAAKEVYCSQHFQACRKYAQSQGGWKILSPLYKVLEPEEIISPYDLSPRSLSPNEHQQWAQEVARRIMQKTNPDTEIIFLTVKLYQKQVIPILKAHKYVIRTPMEGLGIGQQIRWLTDKLSASKQLELKI
ncbi:DUF6884 domain-containing protein [Chlorogloeopsis sp. ULAP02]